ncbi:hypothetical protein GWI33_018203 [Rhynchophorus ferrugineus]|uniref:Uncharacterized protein n=1 Tax=Rhynchophorus ferrugineus TaxID=354439 RepID=A0A834HWU2_RHYFE|nr:hypothetical protein GWI33_018203 [Rhynchophorus ferrugineus]
MSSATDGRCPTRHHPKPPPRPSLSSALSRSNRSPSLLPASPPLFDRTRGWRYRFRQRSKPKGTSRYNAERKIENGVSPVTFVPLRPRRGAFVDDAMLGGARGDEGGLARTGGSPSIFLRGKWGTEKTGIVDSWKGRVHF